MGGDHITRRDAEISDCGRYRWRLDRWWGEGRAVVWIMLNPSTADATKDDQTIRECVRRSRRWGYSGMIAVNLCPLRATDPAEAAAWLKSRESEGRVGDNLMHVLRATWPAGVVVAAWGAHPAFADHARGMRKTLEVAGVQLHHLGLTAGGNPKHPLARGRHRISRDQWPVHWEPEGRPASQAGGGQAAAPIPRPPAFAKPASAGEGRSRGPAPGGESS